MDVSQHLYTISKKRPETVASLIEYFIKIPRCLVRMARSLCQYPASCSGTAAGTARKRRIHGDVQIDLALSPCSISLGDSGHWPGTNTVSWWGWEGKGMIDFHLGNSVSLRDSIRLVHVYGSSVGRCLL
jgi:hypothetical protein